MYKECLDNQADKDDNEEEYSDYNHHCNEDIYNEEFYTKKCCIPKIWLSPGPREQNLFDGEVIKIKKFNVYCFT
jgi:hypothetical protein